MGRMFALGQDMCVCWFETCSVYLLRGSRCPKMPQLGTESKSCRVRFGTVLP